MTKRAKTQFEADPFQWYVEEPFVVEQVLDSLDFGGLIWDASCGGGTVLDIARARGYRTFGSDVVDRGASAKGHQFRRLDFLRLRGLPFRAPLGCRVSLLCNPPYGTVAGVRFMANKFVAHALRYFAEDLYRMAFIVPIEFMAGQDRYRDIYSQRLPSHSLICCERPSMLPGNELARGSKPGGGMADYCVLVWTRGDNDRCETIFMRPSNASLTGTERRLK